MMEISIIDDCFSMTDVDNTNRHKQKYIRGLLYHLSASVMIGGIIALSYWTYILVSEIEIIPDHE
jgi:hypothetical protein